MPGVYDKLGIRFLYPDNWTLDESEMLEGNSTVSVYSPGGAFWSIIAHPPELDPADLVDAALEAMRQEYDELDAEPFHDVISGYEVVGSDLNFYCLDLTNTAQIRSFSTDDASYLVLCQADDREYDEIGGVFEAMTRSLLDPATKSSTFVNSTRALAAEDAGGA
jgi:hypothetical protein